MAKRRACTMKPDTSLKIALGLTTNEKENRGHTKETRSGKEYPNIRADRFLVTLSTLHCTTLNTTTT